MESNDEATFWNVGESSYKRCRVEYDDLHGRLEMQHTEPPSAHDCNDFVERNVFTGNEQRVSYNWNDEVTFSNAEGDISAFGGVGLNIMYSSTSPSALLGSPKLQCLWNSFAPQPLEDEVLSNEASSLLGDSGSHGNHDTEAVCFGELRNISVKLKSPVISGPVRVKLGNDRTLLNDIELPMGNIQQDVAGVLRLLSAERGVELQLICFPKTSSVSLRNDNHVRDVSHAAESLSVIIYGPMTVYDEIGEFLQDVGMYLQDPQYCDRNVRYRNPHRLSGLDEDAPMTSELKKLEPQEKRAEEFLQTPIDVFSDFETQTLLSETTSPSCLTTELYSHQKQALTFMLKRENGWALSDAAQDIWRELIDGKRRRYVNNITGDIQDSIPVQFRGGLLTDQMGLGKTLTTIGLIASDRNPTGKLAITKEDTVESLLSKRKTTLLVAPSTLLDMWNAQLERHLEPGTLKWVTHHGPRRLSTTAQICQYDIVLTSYQTITSEWRKRESVSSPILLHKWHRIALDEGHQIRNSNTIAAKALCSLESRSRWIVTGTPIQNRLSDLMSLLQFLRIYPYNETTVFEAHIVEPWKRGNEEQAIERLKKLFMAIALRRSKSVVELPARVNIMRRLDFTEAELEQYCEAETSIARTLDHAIRTGSYGSNVYANALQRINQLRMICNLGTFVKFSKQDSNKYPAQEIWNNCTAQGYLNGLVTVGAAKCAECGVDLESLSQQAAEESPGKLFECLVLFCSQCFQKRDKKRSSHCYACGKATPCPSAVVSTSCSSSELSNSAWASNHEIEFPTKVKSLLEDITSLPDNTKSVVFSFWTSTLDIVELALNRSSISCTRVDGKLNMKKRISAFQNFRDNKNVAVLLLSLSCGAVGIDLTSASRAYLMEPHWNPHVEEQAFARIHRMGQLQEVTTIRYVMNNSFEDHMLKLQTRKAHLAGLLFSQKRISDSEVNMSRIHHLRSLLT